MCKFVYVPTYIHAFVHACIYIYVCIYAYIYLYACMHMYIYMFPCLSFSFSLYMYICECIFISLFMSYILSYAICLFFKSPRWWRGAEPSPSGCLSWCLPDTPFLCFLFICLKQKIVLDYYFLFICFFRLFVYLCVHSLPALCSFDSMLTSRSQILSAERRHSSMPVFAFL